MYMFVYICICIDGAQSTGSCDEAQSAAERKYPTSEIGGRNREDPMPEARRPRGVTPCPRSGAVAESARLRRCRNGREELPRIRGRGGGAAERSYPESEIRSGGREDQPHVQGAMAVWVQEGLEELSHIEGQEGPW